MSIESTLTQGLGISGGYSAPIGDMLTQGYAFGDDSIISDADAQKIANYVWAQLLEDGKSAEQLMRGFAAALLAKASGLDGFAPQYRDLADTKDRIDAQTDKYGNRSSVTLDLD
jgi:hypothetical protein